MNSEHIAALLQAAFPNAQIEVTGQAGKFDLKIVDDQFANLRPVARQQAVYVPLNDDIASGAIHAVSIRALTVEENRKASLFGM